MLDQKLLERQARETGLCPVREELFGQCFDEIIRQVTLDDPNRGMLLHRVRDDIKRTNEAYTILYQNAVTFAMRKQLQAEHGKQELVDQINAEKKLRQTQMNRIVEMKRRIEDLNTRNRERREVDDKKREEELKFLNFQNEHLKAFFRQIDEKT